MLYYYLDKQTGGTNTMAEFDKVQGLGEEVSSEEQAKQQQEEQRKEEREAITRVIAGKNDVFNKHYKFEELGNLEFDIKIKIPNALEQAKIQAQTERYFDGLGSLMPLRVQEAYRMLATLRICGKEVPDLLANDEEIYNIQILNVIGDDFRNWMNSFRY